MYYIKQEKVEDLKNGRTVISISKILHLNYQNLVVIFNGAKCKKILAMSLISLRFQIPINSPEMDKYLEDYFEKDKNIMEE